MECTFHLILFNSFILGDEQWAKKIKSKQKRKNALKKILCKIRIAGFDGLECNRNNYVDMSFMDRNNIMDLKQTNDEIRKLYLTFKD